MFFNNEKKIKMLKFVIVILVMFITLWGLYLKFGDAKLIYKNSYKPMINFSDSKRFFWTFSPFHNANPFDYKIKDFILNIIAFIPFGFSLSILLNSNYNILNIIFKTVLFGFIFSCFIELLQYITIFGGIAINDMVSNTIGSFFGFICFIVFDKLIKKESIKNVGLLFMSVILLIISVYAIYTIINNIDLFYNMIRKTA